MTDQRMSQDEFTAYIAEKIRTLHSESHVPQFVALSGKDCTGKSTLAVGVQKQLNSLGLSVTLLSIDAFLIPRHLREVSMPEFIDYFENAFDYAALVQTLETVKDSLSSTDPKSCDIILVEGVFLLRRELYGWWDLTVWVAVDTSVIMNRAIQRDKEYFGDERTVRRVYENRCLPVQDYHVRRDLPDQNADITATFENGLWTSTHMVIERELAQSEIDTE